MIKRFVTASILLLLLSCNNSNNTSSTADTTAKTTNADTTTAIGESYYQFTEDSVLIKPFTINVSLSPKATAKITGSKVTVIINISFTGTPKDSSKVKLGEDGSFYVASFEKEITYPATAVFDNIKFPKKIYDQLADKDIEANVNVYSGRKSSPDNLLNCDLLADKVSNLVNKTFTIKGKLIYGDD